MGRQRTPQLIGREDALRRLGAALERVSPSQGSLVLVSGEAGIGKTRLLDEFAGYLEEVVAVRGGCVAGVAYAPWTEALWWLLEHAGAGVVESLPDAVAARLGRLIPAVGVAEAAPTDPQDGPHLLFESVVELLRHVATRTKLMLVVDDVHWIDPASRELLRYVAGSLRRVPILLVVAYRVEACAAERELIAQLGRLGDDNITLERLPDSSTAKIAAILLGSDEAAADVKRIARDADGNPLFVEELVAAAGTKGIPPSLRDLLLARFVSLDDEARHLVRVAAVIGAHAPRTWLLRAWGRGADRARWAARAAVDAGVLVADATGGYEFSHALLRQAVLDELVPDERVALHYGIAEALAEDAACAVGVDRVGELARHWDAAEAAAPALRWLVAAARHARENYAFEAAFAAYERALVWWKVVDDAREVAGVDHPALLLEAADSGGLAGCIERAADLARAGLDESFALGAERGVEAAGRAYPLLWNADRASELFEFATGNVLPVLDRVGAGVRARFLVTRAEHLASYAPPSETRGPAAEMMAALDQIADPVLEARAHVVNAWCHEAFGEFEEVDREYERAAALALDADAHSMLALVLLNHASFKTGVPDLVECVALLDTVDELIERFGLRRNLVSARCLRAFAASLMGDLDVAAAAVASIDGLFLEGLDAWHVARSRARLDLFAGDADGVLAELEPARIGAALPKDTELAIEITTLRADALAWKGDFAEARRAVDEGMVAVEGHPEAYWQGWFSMVGCRVEADVATASAETRMLDVIEHAQSRAAALVEGFRESLAGLQNSNRMAYAHARAIDVEWARLRGEDVAEQARQAADAFEAIAMPYYATYFRWRSAEAMLEEGDRLGATELLKRARAVAVAHGFGHLETAISALARAHQVRLGPRRTTVDGDEALSVRELEVLRLLVRGMSNPQIAETLFISRRTAVAHVSSILRKLDTSSRVEAVSEALRRGYA